MVRTYVKHHRYSNLFGSPERSPQQPHLEQDSTGMYNKDSASSVASQSGFGATSKLNPTGNKDELPDAKYKILDDDEKTNDMDSRTFGHSSDQLRKEPNYNSISFQQEMNATSNVCSDGDIEQMLKNTQRLPLRSKSRKKLEQPVELEWWQKRNLPIQKQENNNTLRKKLWNDVCDDENDYRSDLLAQIEFKNLRLKEEKKRDKNMEKIYEQKIIEQQIMMQKQYEEEEGIKKAKEEMIFKRQHEVDKYNLEMIKEAKEKKKREAERKFKANKIAEEKEKKYKTDSRNMPFRSKSPPIPALRKADVTNKVYSGANVAITSSEINNKKETELPQEDQTLGKNICLADKIIMNRVKHI